jgi:hypothetical protein
MRWRVEVALLGGRRPLLIFNRRWEDLGRYRRPYWHEFYFPQFICGGCSKEVAYACLALLFDGGRGEIVGCI